jgi:hypothetical protein
MEKGAVFHAGLGPFGGTPCGGSGRRRRNVTPTLSSDSDTAISRVRFPRGLCCLRAGPDSSGCQHSRDGWNIGTPQPGGLRGLRKAGRNQNAGPPVAQGAAPAARASRGAAGAGTCHPQGAA